MGSNITQAMLSKVERGRVQPSEDLVWPIAETLGLREGFFFDDSYLRQPPLSYHRKRSKLSARDLAAIHALSEGFRLSLLKCLTSVELEHDGPSLPVYDLDQFDGDASEAARAVRTRLKISRGPVRNISKIIESSGVILVPFSFGTTLIDGFCQHTYRACPR